MSDLRPKGKKVTIGGKEWNLIFTIGAIDEIQEHFDKTIEEVFKMFQDSRKLYKTLMAVTMILINEAIDVQNEKNKTNEPYINEKYVGNNLDITSGGKVLGEIMQAFYEGSYEGEEDPNQKSVSQN